VRKMLPQKMNDLNVTALGRKDVVFVHL
jgi:hypothetical protein